MREKTSQTTSPRIATATRTSGEPVQLQQLIKGAETAAAQYERDEARVEGWGRDSFPASDPPQNY